MCAPLPLQTVLLKVCKRNHKTVTESRNMERLDKFLARELNITRSGARSLIRSGGVSVNSSPACSADHGDLHCRAGASAVRRGSLGRRFGTGLRPAARRAQAHPGPAGPLRPAVLRRRGRRRYRLRPRRRRRGAAALSPAGNAFGQRVLFLPLQRAAAPAVGLLDGCGGVLRPPERAPAASGRKIFAKNRPAGEKTLSFLEQMG